MNSATVLNLKNIYTNHFFYFHFALISLTCLAVFSNNFQHQFLLDSGHTVSENPTVRSLKNIPDYFVDPETFSTLRDHADYRPVLQTSYALNYWISGYDTWSWHLTQIFLHLTCAFGLYFFCWKIISFCHAGESAAFKIHTPLFAALLFAANPTTSGVVNYFSARSSLLVAAFLLPSFVIYMKSKDFPNYAETPWLVFLLFTFALFTKVETVGALAVYWLYEITPFGNQKRAEGFLKNILTSLNKTTLRRLWPFLAVTAIYFGIRSVLLPDYLAEARRTLDMTPDAYFYTQLTVWWHYVFQWFVPVNLVADNLVYPIFRTLWHPNVLLAISGWLVVAAILKGTYGKYPHFMFLTISALALISPTSSIAPLAEMVNEHRPYLPLAILSLTWVIPLSIFMFASISSGRFFKGLAIGGFLLLFFSFSALTWKRNVVYQTSENYWLDILQKAPSSRAHVNYGLTQMRQGLNENALEHFQKSLELAPNWHITHINLAIVYESLGQNEKPLFHYNRAVATDIYTSAALVYRGEYYLKIKEYALALADFQNAIPRNLQFYRLKNRLATAYAGLGSWRESLDYTKKCLEIDPVQAEQDIVMISTPFWENANFYQAGIDYYQALTAYLPGRWWLYENIGNLAKRLENSALSQTALARSAELKDR